MCKVFVIGDLHFREKKLIQATEFTEKFFPILSKNKPDFIVILGDILDTNNISRIESFIFAYDFFEKCSRIANTFVLIGNHDYMNEKQFLTDKHFFVPLKKYENIVVVDNIVNYKFSENLLFTFVPYVPPNRFKEALISSEIDWELSTCIFAHQEFKGSVPFGICEEEWDVDYPLVISGHIHEHKKFQDNLFYTGSSMQIKCDENPDKKVWLFEFQEDGEYKVTDFDLNLSKIVKRNITIEEIENLDFSDFDFKKNNYVFHIPATKDQITIFKKSDVYNFLKKNCKVFFILVDENNENNEDIEIIEHDNFEKVLLSLLDKKPEKIKECYSEILSGNANTNIIF